MNEPNHEKHHPDVVAYRKKPVVVWAYKAKKTVDVATPEGTMTALVGDMVIQGVKGEQYPCKPDIFEATYEPAECSSDVSVTVDNLYPKILEYLERLLDHGLFGMSLDEVAERLMLAELRRMLAEQPELFDGRRGVR